jgi:hypothetical protein
MVLTLIYLVQLIIMYLIQFQPVVTVVLMLPQPNSHQSSLQSNCGEDCGIEHFSVKIEYGDVKIDSCED